MNEDSVEHEEKLKLADFCNICGKPMPEYVFSHFGGMFSSPLRLCEPCHWKECEKSLRMLPQPFKNPIKRGRKDGAIPQWFLHMLRNNRRPMNE